MVKTFMAYGQDFRGKKHEHHSLLLQDRRLLGLPVLELRISWYPMFVAVVKILVGEPNLPTKTGVRGRARIAGGPQGLGR